MFYNDSAATIPQATVAAVKSFKNPVLLITGGTDKEIDFSVLEEIKNKPKKIFLLEGTGTDKIIPLFKRINQTFKGPYNSLKTALEDAVHNSKKGDIILLSPGCASFGMFKNEFDRGNQFKDMVNRLS
jgi:UDP-N-acetylmuramoylalanine--D-glutamate ligase